MCTYNFIYTYTHTSYNYTFIISKYTYIYIHMITHGGMSVAKLDYQSAMQLVLHLGSCTGLTKSPAATASGHLTTSDPGFPTIGAKKHCASTLAVRRKWGDLTWLVHLIGTKDAKQTSYTGNYVCRLLPSLFNSHCFQIYSARSKFAFPH